MELPKRKSIRIPGFDYASDHFYFVTICTDQKRKLFGMGQQLTALGKIAEQELLQLPSHFPDVRIDAYVIMPNHIHAIVVIGCDGSQNHPELTTVMGLYKSGVSRQIHAVSTIKTIWQRSFYDRVIRKDIEYQEIRRYIEENPLKWQLDQLYIP